jgi:hypothetical protein
VLVIGKALRLCVKQQENILRDVLRLGVVSAAGICGAQYCIAEFSECVQRLVDVGRHLLPPPFIYNTLEESVSVRYEKIFLIILRIEEYTEKSGSEKLNRELRTPAFRVHPVLNKV